MITPYTNDRHIFFFHARSYSATVVEFLYISFEEFDWIFFANFKFKYQKSSKNVWKNCHCEVETECVTENSLNTMKFSAIRTHITHQRRRSLNFGNVLCHKLNFLNTSQVYTCGYKNVVLFESQLVGSHIVKNGSIFNWQHTPQKVLNWWKFIDFSLINKFLFYSPTVYWLSHVTYYYLPKIQAKKSPHQRQWHHIASLCLHLFHWITHTVNRMKRKYRTGGKKCGNNIFQTD